MADGVLHGLGSVDMKGPVAACIIAARGLPGRAGHAADHHRRGNQQAGRARHRGRSDAARALGLRGIVVAEPTGLLPVRGHRSHIEYTAVAPGVQAHSSTGQGSNANWALIPFLAEMKAVFDACATTRPSTMPATTRPSATST